MRFAKLRNGIAATRRRRGRRVSHVDVLHARLKLGRVGGRRHLFDLKNSSDGVVIVFSVLLQRKRGKGMRLKCSTGVKSGRASAACTVRAPVISVSGPRNAPGMRGPGGNETP